MADYTVERWFKKKVALNIKQLIEMGCYRGTRHKRSLPVREDKRTKNKYPYKKKDQENWLARARNNRF